MALQFGDIARSIERFEIVDMLIFLLIFTILFAVLEKSRILGEENRNMNIGLALIISLIVLFINFTGAVPDSSNPFIIIKKALPQISIVVVAIISLLILLGVFAHDRVYLGLSAPGWVGFFSIITIIFIFGSAAGWWQPTFLDFLEGIFGNDAIAIVIMVLIFGIIIAFITGESRQKVGAMERAGVAIKELFGGKK